jgi:hypothetical protein
VFERNQGATERTIEALVQLIMRPSNDSATGQTHGARHEAFSA